MQSLNSILLRSFIKNLKKHRLTLDYVLMITDNSQTLFTPSDTTWSGATIYPKFTFVLRTSPFDLPEEKI